MKKLIVLLITALLFVACEQFTEPQTESAQIEKGAYSVTGEIAIVGNVPFTDPAIFYTSSNSYVLICDDDTDTYFRNNQGVTFTVYYDSTAWTPNGTGVVVESYEKL